MALMTPSTPREALAVLKDRGTMEVRHRTKILRFHGYKAATVGVFILVFGFNRSVEQNVGVWTRGALGFAALLAGMFLIAVTHEGDPDNPTRMRWQLRGLFILLGWDVLMSTAVVAATVDYAIFEGWQLTPFWAESPPPPQPIPFPMVIYAALAAFLWIHSRTIVEVLRGKT